MGRQPARQRSRADCCFTSTWTMARCRRGRRRCAERGPVRRRPTARVPPPRVLSSAGNWRVWAPPPG